MSCKSGLIGKNARPLQFGTFIVLLRLSDFSGESYPVADENKLLPYKLKRVLIFSF